jgi:acyl-coenzyme A thioesterase PaaI-like protein
MNATWVRKFEEKIPAKVFRHLWNLYRPFRGAGIYIEEISDDYLYIRVRLKMNWSNVNYVGTHFGGSLYAMTDPFFMLILLKNLGRDFIVWDKGAKIDFKKPGKGVLRAEFRFSPEEVAEIRDRARQAENGKWVFDKPVKVIDEQGEVITEVIKTLYVRFKNPQRKLEAPK